ncbi:TraX family protein [uncultured Tyzzerella sp.]|uniref:TraX family protein n=1 Tax=uncultured Tyzzerella sp. TaxID=2321398 RepID=UPI002942C1FF|nr:TraX family protein [uncultured Tyzzerella sp.]
MTSFNLKIIALITMFIDHIGSVIFPNHFYIRFIGRLAFPIYAFLISEGLKNTSNIKNYVKDLFILALISELFYDICFNTSINLFYNTNTVYTLFLASISIYFYNKINTITIKYLCLFLGISLSYIFKTDYDILGVLLIYIFYFSKNKYNYLTYGIIWVNLKYLNNISSILYSKFNTNMYLSNTYITNSLGLYLFTIIPFFIIFYYNGKKGKNIKYLFYLLYPLHLFILCIIKLFIL